MGRAPCCDKANVKKGPWSPEEDAKLKEYIKINGTGGNWISLPSKAGLKRCGKSCRLRWINYLRPDIKHGSFTEEEENTIYRLHHTIGSRWSLIAAQLPGRTDNDIKNYWNTRLKKKLAERGMDMQHNQRHTHMQNMQNIQSIQNLVLQFPGLQNVPVDGQLYDPTQVMNFCALRQQQEMDALLRGSQSVTVPTFAHHHHQQHQQHLHQPMMPVKEELVSARTGLPNAGIDERLMMIESSLRSCITTPLVPNTMAPLTNIQPISVHQPAMAPMSPVPVEQSHHQSPTSSCSGISSDRSYGGQLADSAYSESFSNSYDDPTSCFPDSQRSSLMSAPSLLPPPPQQMQNLEAARKSHSTSGSAFAPERFGLEEAFPNMESYRSVPMEAGVDRQVVKEELATDWWNGVVVSPRTPRTSMCSKWFVPSPRCGAENVFSVQNPTIQSASTLSLEACLDPYAFAFKNNYVAI